MYPQINLGGGFTNPSPINTAASGVAGGPESPAREPGSSTSLRVCIAEKFRVAPPVPAPATITTTTTSSSLTFDYEKQILTELDNQSRLINPAEGEEGLRRQDRCEALMSQCQAAGNTRETAALALSVALATGGGQRADVAQMKMEQAAAGINHLVAMGFGKSDAVGALVAKNGNVQAAIDMLTM